MSQIFIPAVFYRGGTSKGVFFQPAICRGSKRRVVGSCWRRSAAQLNGMGGGISSLSKAVMIGPPSIRMQTWITPSCNWRSTNRSQTGAIIAAIFLRRSAISRRTCLGSRWRDARSHSPDQHAQADSFPLFGKGRQSSRLDFLSPDGAVTGKLLPTGNVVDKIDLGEDGCFELSIVDATSPVVYLEARAFGLTGSESPDVIEARPAVMDLLEQLRRRAGVLIGLAREPEQIGLQTPRIAVVGAPIRFNSLDGQHYDANDFDIATRMMSMQRAHRAIPGTGGLNLGVASQVPGSIPNRVSRPANGAGEIRVANPSGLVSVGAVVRRSKGQWTADSAILFRTARRLMQGEVAVPSEAIS